MVLAAAFSFAPLTGGTSGTSQSEEYLMRASSERSFCASNLSNVNCVCFGHISGLILSDEQPKVLGVRYANREDLARRQAIGSC